MLSICLDFDGVLHSYTSGWKGATVIPDLPVPGALQFLITAISSFDVYIYSSRSHKFGGRTAMKKWIINSYLNIGSYDKFAPQWLKDYVNTAMGSQTTAIWNINLENAISVIISQLKFPNYKPTVHLTIDDRAMTFTGSWPSVGAIESFIPWNK